MKANNGEQLKLLPELSSLKESEAFEDKVYNWNILSDCFETLGIHLTADKIEDILEGDSSFLPEILTSLIKIAENHTIQSLDNSKSIDILTKIDKNANEPQSVFFI